MSLSDQKREFQLGYNLILVEFELTMYRDLALHILKVISPTSAYLSQK